MKKSVLFLTCCLAISAAFVISSCSTEKTKKLSEKIEKSQWGENPTTSKTTYEYDENGNLLSATTKNSGGYSSVQKETYKYDENSRLICKTYYFDGEANSRETYTYNEDGDTICYTLEYKNDDEWEASEKTTYKYSDGVKTDTYEYHRWQGECEEVAYSDQVIHRSFDSEGRVIKELGYNNKDWEHTDGQVDISSKVSDNPEKEFNRVIEDFSLEGPETTTYKYNDAGKLKSVKRDGESGSSTEYTYNSNNQLVKEVSQYEYMDGDVVTTYTYDSEGRTLSKKTVQSGEYGYGNTTTWKYNESGDTLQQITISTWNDGTEHVTGKIYYEYEDTENGVIKTKYCAGTEDDWGHDGQSFTKTVYDEEGYIVESYYYSPSDYVENYELSKEFASSGQKELNNLKNQFNFEQKSHTTYTYIVTETSNNPLSPIINYVKGLIGSSDKDDKPAKGSSGVEYETE